MGHTLRSGCLAALALRLYGCSLASAYAQPLPRDASTSAPPTTTATPALDAAPGARSDASADASVYASWSNERLSGPACARWTACTGHRGREGCCVGCGAYTLRVPWTRAQGIRILEAADCNEVRRITRF